MEVAAIEFDYIKVEILRLILKGVLFATPEKLSAKFAFKIVKGDLWQLPRMTIMAICTLLNYTGGTILATTEYIPLLIT